MGLVGGRYEIADRIGGGGMADVFRARDRTLDRDVALKVLRAAFVGDAEFVERFHREAEALAAIEHPNIVRVFDYGASPDGPFIAMELVGGGTLRDLMRARGRVDQYAAVDLAAGIADGLEAAHIRGVLHRDLKPDNVLLDDDLRPKIADFGIARLAAATALTRTGELLGTPHYLAPEQMSGEVVDERADIYALGVILYEMLTGTQPTGGATPSEIVSRRLRTDPRPPSRLVPLAPAINSLVLRALARDPARRFRRAADLRAALLAIKPPVSPAPSGARAVRWQRPSLAPLTAVFASLAAFNRDAVREFRRVSGIRVALPAIKPPAVAGPLRAGVATWRRRLSTALAAVLASLAALLAAFTQDAARVFRRAADIRLAPPAIKPPAVVASTRALVSTSMRDAADRLRYLADRRASLLAMRPPTPPVTTRVRVVHARRRSPAPLVAALALLTALVGGSLVFAGARPVALVPAPVATATPAPAVLASTASPAATATPIATPESTAEPTPVPTAEPTLAATPAPVVAATVSGDPAGTIVTFYQLVSGHDYASASGLWSDRMRASYPPQTNIWGRFEATRSIVARSAAVTSASPGSAAVAVDLVETLGNGTVRRWVGTWYLVRSGSGWLLDQPGLRPG